MSFSSVSETKTLFKNIYVQHPDPQVKYTFKIAEWNVDRAWLHEKSRPWNGREKEIDALIREMDADVLCLLELRELPGVKPVYEWLGQFAPKYRFVIGYCNASELAFGQAILYKPDKLFLLEQKVRCAHWPSDDVDPKGDGRIVVSAHFAPVYKGMIVQDAPTFWVDNCHFPLEETAKTKSCEVYVQMIQDRKDPTVMMGDLKFFPDGDEQKQRAVLEQNGLQDLGKEGHVTIKGTKRFSTFNGFDDPTKQGLEDKFRVPFGKDPKQRLDNMYVTKEIVHVQPFITLYTKTMKNPEPEELTTYDYPSDHFPLITTVQIMNQ